MRVLYLSDSYGPHDHRFLTAAAALGYEVFFLRRSSRPGIESRPLPEGVRLLPPLALPAAPMRRLGMKLADDLHRRLEGLEIDLVHAGPVQGCAWLAASWRFPALLTMSWGSDLLRKAKFGLGRWLAATTLHRSAGFLGDCRAVLESAAELGMDPSIAFIFPWGVDLGAFMPGTTSVLRRQLGWERFPTAICVRSWEPGYGLETVLEGFARAAARRQDLRLILAGDGSLRPWVLDFIERSGLESRIWLPGGVAYADLPEFYRAADLYMSASISDGSSVSLLEAMACGLPALVSDIPGNREWVEPAGNGWLFDVEDVDILAEYLLAAFARGDQRHSMGRRSREIAEARADWSQHAPRLAEAYAATLERAERSR
jgi:glycosyltransferase involved in cell wall biosynthesis